MEPTSNARHDNEFHPDCISIKVMQEKLLGIEEQLECRECNPNNPHLFSKEKDWSSNRSKTQSRKQNTNLISQKKY
jgi:hypothetical protein